MNEKQKKHRVLTLKQKRFCEEYLKDFNGQKAAERAGYEPKYAREAASVTLAKPQGKEYINQLLEEANLGPQEVIKLISDMARSNLNDYFVIRQQEYTPRIKKSLGDLILELEEQIDFEEEFALIAGLEGKELKRHQANLEDLRKQVIRFEIELRRNPDAFRIVNGQTEFIEIAELDMPKLVRDKERGRIKTLSPGQYGTKVELYAADSALSNLAKIHGLFAPEKVEVAGKNGAPLQGVTFISASALSPEQIEKYMNGDRTDDESF